MLAVPLKYKFIYHLVGTPTIEQFVAVHYNPPTKYTASWKRMRNAFLRARL